MQGILLEDCIYDPTSQVEDDGGTFTVLLTRYNMVTSFRPSDMQRWTAARLPLFRRICLPSVLGQSRRPDRWLIGFSGSKDAVGDVLRSIEPYPWIVPFWQDDERTSSFAKAVAMQAPRDARRVLSIRLDNDDAIHSEFVAACRTYAASVLASRPGPPDFWLSFPLGAQLYRGGCTLKVDSNSHFLARCSSLSESGVPVVSAIDHRQLFKDNRLVFTPLTARPMWLENIHKTNVANVAQRSSATLSPTPTVLREFGVEAGTVFGRWRQAAQALVRSIR